MKVALVYDRVNKFGGAERVLLALHEIWPQAPLYTAVYYPETAPWASRFRVVPSFLNRIPLAKKHHELFAWLMPLAFESFNFSEYDLVISVTSEAAKGIITGPETLHLCYCLTPTRYLYSGYDQYFRSSASRVLAYPLVGYLRYWDQVAARRPDVYLAISKNVQKRINRYYHQEAKVIYPPINLENFKSGDNQSPPIPDSYFLVVSRLVPYKRIDLVVETFNQLGLPLKIVGTGSQEKKLQRTTGKNVEFLGELTDRQLVSYYQQCLAVIFPQEEDFGLVPLEAQACGKPVIAYRGGGALETVIEGRTGLFFYPQTAVALASVVKSFKPERFSLKACRKNASRFSQRKFKREFKKLAKSKWKNIRN